jgi:hypothetical protein
VEDPQGNRAPPRGSSSPAEDALREGQVRLHGDRGVGLEQWMVLQLRDGGGRVPCCLL